MVATATTSINTVTNDDDDLGDLNDSPKSPSRKFNWSQVTHYIR